MSLITPNDRIFVAGHRGMAGSAICRALQRAGYSNLLTATREELDLENPLAVHGWFEAMRPDVVVLAAAKVGGIHFNNTYPADFLLDNLKIETHVIESAWRSGVRRLLFLGSSCIYPRLAAQPIKEEALLAGPPEPTNKWHAIAKIARIKLCKSLRLQYGLDAISLMLTNLYGPGDSYHTMNSHVLPALIRRFHEAVQAGAPAVICWGSGTPRREFLHVNSLGEACVFALERWQPSAEDPPHLSVGTGEVLAIHELAELSAEVSGYRSTIHWDTKKLYATTMKQLDANQLQAMDWIARIRLKKGALSTAKDSILQIKKEKFCSNTSGVTHYKHSRAPTTNIQNANNDRLLNNGIFSANNQIIPFRPSNKSHATNILSLNQSPILSAARIPLSAVNRISRFNITRSNSSFRRS